MLRSNETLFVKQQYATNANLDARIALHEKFSVAPEAFHDWLFRHVDLPDDARVLEIGCGSGALWERVRAKIPSAWQLTLSDFSFGMAQTVQQKFLDARFSFVNCDAQHLPFAAETFDGIFANHMLYHVPNLDRALAELRRVLKRGGKLYAATNGLGHMRELGDLVSDVTRQPMQGEPPERIFGLENGEAILSQHFENVARLTQENSLRVTEIEPLVAYIKSGRMYQSAAETALLEQTFRARVQNEIDAHGAFHITKAVGMFVARREI
ncbi:class I SAM-dependent methyltransferase [Anaerolineae bacterium CFX7]|nr:class I SAM-dependent methyltransferase [Anaerolineae bacterium CFX7]